MVGFGERVVLRYRAAVRRRQECRRDVGSKGTKSLGAAEFEPIATFAGGTRAHRAGAARRSRLALCLGRHTHREAFSDTRDRRHADREFRLCAGACAGDRLEPRRIECRNILGVGAVPHLRVAARQFFAFGGERARVSDLRDGRRSAHRSGAVRRFDSGCNDRRDTRAPLRALGRDDAGDRRVRRHRGLYGRRLALHIRRSAKFGGWRAAAVVAVQPAGRRLRAGLDGHQHGLRPQRIFAG